jgi:hypothetical protein
MVIIDEDDYFAHYGTPRHSGRYPWGSGGPDSSTPRNPSFVDLVTDLRKQGLKDTEIAEGLGIGSVDRTGKFVPSTTQLRAKYTIAKNEEQLAKITMAQSLKDKGYSNGAIAERMGLAGESSVRALLAPGAKDRVDVLTQTANMLKRHVDEKTYVDIGGGTEKYLGDGVENYVGISKEKLGAAVAILKEQGYVVHTVPVQQIGTGKDTRVKVLAPPGTTWGDVRRNQDKIQTITEFSEDGGRTFNKTKDPITVDPRRVDVKYYEDGGGKADGVIFVRPGVPDVSLGGKRYGQVRVKVGDDHYLKGMAMYKDDLPDGVDLVFHTKKSDTGNKFDAMKPLKKDAEGNLDPDLPFGSVIRQILDKPGDPKANVTSAMNLVNEEGDWSTWSRNLSSQMLSKQSPALAKNQLAITLDRRQKEFDEIMALTNPTVKKNLLEDFASSTDSAAVHLKAAALPRQATHVILPLSSISPTQIYAPGYNNGERVVLIRFPHGGTFEIPELTVNNKHAEGRKLLGTDSVDVVGIHHKVAERLSGADFDGDTVLVIPNNLGKVKTSPALEGLKNFDVMKYKIPDDSPIPRIKPERKQQEMGNISNLITDMTIQGASHDQLARAVRHSMVVIDAEKHGLNYKQSAVDNGIRQLKEEYQKGPRGGASTLISRKKSYDVGPELKLRPMSEGGPIDRETGRRVFVETGRTRFNAKTGERVPRTSKINRLDATDDAFTLSSGTPMEKHYAAHSNALKALANRARLESLKTPPIKYSPSANRTYAKEVATLTAKLSLAERNAPRERQAQLIAQATLKAKRAAHPEMEPDTIKKVKFQALEEARNRVGAGKKKIEITQEEWNAIQAGAITNNRLSQILKHADKERVRKLATPKRQLKMTPNMTNRAERLLSIGYTRAEVAKDLGVSLTTLDTAIRGEVGEL